MVVNVQQAVAEKDINHIVNEMRPVAMQISLD